MFYLALGLLIVGVMTLLALFTVATPAELTKIVLIIGWALVVIGSAIVLSGK
jgi:hypothetical protein